MNFTIHDTPIVIHFLRGITGIFLRLSGWKIDKTGMPDKGNYFIIIAPHTSNWDFFIGIAMAFQLQVRAHWVGKHTLFKGSIGPIAKWLGGIPLDRSQHNNTVQTCIDAYAKSDNMIFAITPEGTRSWVPRWKTGFYHIAQGANVPIALAYLDYKEKKGGLGKLLYPGGNMDKDIRLIEQFYANITAKCPNKYNKQIYSEDNTASTKID